MRVVEPKHTEEQLGQEVSKAHLAKEALVVLEEVEVVGLAAAAVTGEVAIQIPNIFTT